MNATRLGSVGCYTLIDICAWLAHERANSNGWSKQTSVLVYFLGVRTVSRSNDIVDDIPT